MTEQWRVGRRNPHTVYRQHGDTPRGMEHADHDASLGYFRDPADARTAVEAVNARAERVDLAYPAGRWRDVYVRVHGDKEVATTEQVTDTIRVDWSAPTAAGEVDIVGVEVVAATGVEVDGEPAPVPVPAAPDREALAAADRRAATDPAFRAVWSVVATSMALGRHPSEVADVAVAAMRGDAEAEDEDDGLVRAYPELDRLPLARFDPALAELRSDHVPDLVDSLGLALRMFRAAGFEVPELEPQPDKRYRDQDEAPGPSLTPEAEASGKCSQCGQSFAETACGPTHAAAACIYFGGSSRLPAIIAIRRERDEARERVRRAVEDTQARGAQLARNARDVALSRIAAAVGVRVDPDDPDPVGTVETAVADEASHQADLRRRLLALDQEYAHARRQWDADILVGDEVATVPEGSWVIACTTGGEPFVDALPVKRRGCGWSGEAARAPSSSTASYRVLYRAPEPSAAPLAVGDRVTAETVADAPIGALLALDGGVRGLVVDGGLTSGGQRWRHALWSDGQQREQWTARVVDLGPGERADTDGGDSSET